MKSPARPPFFVFSPLGAILAAAASLTLVSGSSLGQAAPGDLTPNLNFAVFDNSGDLEDRSTLADFQQKVLILYYYAPW